MNRSIGNKVEIAEFKQHEAASAPEVEKVVSELGKPIGAVPPLGASEAGGGHRTARRGASAG
jgi:hypothetical protein